MQRTTLKHARESLIEFFHELIDKKALLWLTNAALEIEEQTTFTQYDKIMELWDKLEQSIPIIVPGKDLRDWGVDFPVSGDNLDKVTDYVLPQVPTKYTRVSQTLETVLSEEIQRLNSIAFTNELEKDWLKELQRSYDNLTTMRKGINLIKQNGTDAFVNWFYEELLNIEPVIGKKAKVAIDEINTQRGVGDDNSQMLVPSIATKSSGIKAQANLDNDNSQTRLPKVAIVGPSLVGKTQFIASISENEALTIAVEYKASRSEERVVWGVDFGRITINENLALGLYGTPPGARRFDIGMFKHTILGKDLLGFIIIIDSTNPEPAQYILDSLEAEAVAPYIVAVNWLDHPGVWNADSLRTKLKIRNNIKLVPCCAKDKSDVKVALLELLQLVPDVNIEQIIASVKAI